MRRVRNQAILLCVLALSTLSLTCKPSFLQNEQEKDENPAPWRSFNFTDVEKNIEDSCECGVPPGKFPRISGGKNAGRNEFPWQVALVYRNTRIPFCGGTLINNLYVLTAAHCILNLPKVLLSKGSKEDYLFIENDFQVLVNAYRLTPLNQTSAIELYKRTLLKWWELTHNVAEQDYEEGTLRLDVSQKFYHPEFVTEYRKFGFDFDVALLRLSSPVNLTAPNSPVPICLPKSGKFQGYEKLMGVTVGWGRMNHKDLTSGAPILQKLSVPVYSLDECSSISGISVSKRFICAGHQTKSKDIGKSDSGGPLLVDKQGKFTQIGIVSWGAGEADGKVASVFTRVSAFLRWIHYHILNPGSKVNENEEVVWCSNEESASYRQEEMTTTLAPVVEYYDETNNTVEEYNSL